MIAWHKKLGNRSIDLYKLVKEISVKIDEV